MEEEITGICALCGKASDCRDSNFGTVCISCIQKTLLKKDKTLVVPPQPDRECFVIMGDKDEYITVHGTLYAFDSKGDAEWSCDRIREDLPDEELRVEKTEAMMPFVYGVKERINVIGVRKGLKEHMEKVE